MTAIMLRELIDRCSGRLPADVEARARWLVLDTLGCAIAGSRSPVVGNWLDAQRLRDDPYGTCLDGARPTGAAMALAMGACWDEACEGHARAHGRPGVAALAALWPRVSELDLDHLLRALVIGYEVGARMGALLRIGLGMHVDGNWPALGAAAAAASGLGLDQAGIVTAINIAACQLPTSLYRPIETGDTARNTYLGHGAMLGEMAAQAAAVGIGAPDDAVESYARVAYGRSLDGETADSTTYEILDGYFKPYAAARHVHYAAEAALQLRDRATPESVRRIELWTYEEANVYCGIRAPGPRCRLSSRSPSVWRRCCDGVVWARRSTAAGSSWTRCCAPWRTGSWSGWTRTGPVRGPVPPGFGWGSATGGPWRRSSSR